MKENETKDSESTEASELRRKAEQQMRARNSMPTPAMSEADAVALVHELQVHQIELEMQNEELRRAQAAAAEASEKYYSLFDFAPVGYFLWDHEGRILEVNMAGAALIGQDRSMVVQKRFGQFLAAEHRARFSDFCHLVLASDVKQTCEVKLLNAGQAVTVLVEGIRAQDSRGQEKFCRAAVIDISQQKRANDLAAANRALEAEITARRQAEEALRTSEERLRLAQQAAHVGTFEWDVQKNVNRWTSELEAMYGLPVGGFAGTQQAWEDLLHSDDRAAAVARVEEAFATGAPTEGEWRVIWPDGSVHWLFGRWQVFKDDSGRPVRMTGVNIDISDRKRAEEEIRSLAEFPQENPNPILRVSVDGLVLYANLPALRLLEAMGWEAGQSLPGQMLQRIRGGLEDSRTREFDLTCAVGRTFSFAVAASSRAGQINLYARDITARKQAEESLRRMNELLELHVAERTADLRESVSQVSAERRRFHEVLDALPIYVILLTPDYQVSFANRFFEDRFGKSEGRRCYEYLFNRTEPCEKCETFKVLETNAPHHWEWIGPDGRMYDINDFPFVDADGSQLILEVGMDITLRRQDEIALAERNAEVKRLADQLRALAVELSQAEQRERKRLAKILHDHIQQLLVAARMQVEWIKRDTDAERMQSTAQGVNSILVEALDASRSLTVELSPPVLHETGLVGALSWLASRMHEKHRLKVYLRSDNQAEPASEEMRMLLFECARELLFNAVKHAGVTEVNVALLRTKDGRINLIIRDEGKGFDPGMLNNRRADETTFGLFSIQQRLAHIGGEMEITTAPGRGTSINVVLPAGEAASLTEAKESTAGRVEKNGNVHVRERAIVHRVLVVDDHKIVREGLIGLMQFELDIEIVGQAADGPQAIELTEQLRPHVVIMDVNLPGMSGVEATKNILAKIPEVKVIGLSMHADADMANAMLDAGAIAYLSKGGPSNDLIAAIRAACAG